MHRFTHVTLSSLSMTLVLLAACSTGGNRAADLANQEAPGAGSGKADGATDPVVSELKLKYGVRPRRYNGFFDGSNQAETQFLGLLPNVSQYLNQRAADLGSDATLNEAAIATNFITEGGFYVLDGNQTDGIDGYQELGIDSLVDNYAALKPWLNPIVQMLVESGGNGETAVNEQGQTVHTLTNLTLEQGLWANAGMFAWAKSIAASDLAARGTRITSLPSDGAFFWTTIYYNAGAGTARKLLDRYGIDYYQRKWTHADDPSRYSLDARYNALWRTASYEYMLITVYGGGKADGSAPAGS